MEPSWLFHLPVYPPYPNGTRAGTWCLLEGEFLLCLSLTAFNHRERSLLGSTRCYRLRSPCIHCSFLPRPQLTKYKYIDMEVCLFFSFLAHSLLLAVSAAAYKTMIKYLLSFWVCPPQTIWSSLSLVAIKQAHSTCFMGSIFMQLECLRVSKSLYVLFSYTLWIRCVIKTTWSY